MSIQNMSPHDQLCAAISILQQNILASDSLMSAEIMFKPGGYFATSSLELVERMLMDLLPHVEQMNSKEESND